MKKWALALCMLCTGFRAFGQTDTLNYRFADSLYEQGKYERAIPVYETLLQKNGPSPQLYYNLGNSYYKTNAVGLAILNYERTLKYKPGDDDAKYNLGLANLRIRDKVEPVQDMFLVVWWRDFFRLLSASQWAVLMLALLWLSLIAFILFRTGRSIPLQKAGFTVFLLAFLFFCIAAASGFSRHGYDMNFRYGIITNPSAIVKSGPGENSTNLFLIHEGLKVRMLGSSNGWTKVKMPDGNIGWTQSDAMQAI